MWFLSLLGFLCLDLVLGRSTCGTPTFTSTFTPVILMYTPYMTPQIGPTSIIYETIITTWFNAVDCRYVTPVLVDKNPAAEGPFTTYVRSQILTVTRVGCMPETTAVTRRDVRGQNQIELRNAAPEQEHRVQKRRTALETIHNVIDQLPNTFPPNVTGLTVQAYRYLVSVNTALIAISLVQIQTNLNENLNQTCAQFRDPAAVAEFYNTNIDPIQAGDIVCFAATNGLYFSTGIDSVVTYLENLIYALQVRSTIEDDSEDFCWPLLTENSPFLGINTNGIAEYLCPGSTASLSSSMSGVATSTEPVVPGGIHGTGTGTLAGPPTGGPFANTTAPGTTGQPGYGGNSNTTKTAGIPAPWTNSTVLTSTAEYTTNNIGNVSTSTAYGTGLMFPNATYPSLGTGTAPWSWHAPPTPTSVSPAIESVSSTFTHRFRRW